MTAASWDASLVGAQTSSSSRNATHGWDARCRPWLRTRVTPSGLLVAYDGEGPHSSDARSTSPVPSLEPSSTTIDLDLHADLADRTANRALYELATIVRGDHHRHALGVWARLAFRGPVLGRCREG